MIVDSEPFALTGVVVAEILQGLTKDANRIEHFLEQWEMLEASGFATYREAAAIYRAGRARGIALTTIDTLIAAIALCCRCWIPSSRVFPTNSGLKRSSEELGIVGKRLKPEILNGNESGGGLELWHQRRRLRAF